MSGSDPVYLTRNSAEWVKREQLQRRALPSALSEMRRGAIDRPPGGLWVFGEVLSVDEVTDEAIVKVIVCNVGYNPSVKREVEGTEYDTILCDLSNAMNQDSALIITPPYPELGERAWFMQVHVSGEKSGNEWSPPRWWRVMGPQPLRKTYTLSIDEGIPTGGSFSYSGNDGLGGTVSGTWAWNVSPATVESSISALSGSKVVTGDNLPWNVIKIQVDDNITLGVSSPSLTRAAYAIAPRVSMPFCWEPVL